MNLLRRRPNCLPHQWIVSAMIWREVMEFEKKKLFTSAKSVRLYSLWKLFILLICRIRSEWLFSIPKLQYLVWRLDIWFKRRNCNTNEGQLWFPHEYYLEYVKNWENVERPMLRSKRTTSRSEMFFWSKNLCFITKCHEHIIQLRNRIFASYPQIVSDMKIDGHYSP